MIVKERTNRMAISYLEIGSRASHQRKQLPSEKKQPVLGDTILNTRPECLSPPIVFILRRAPRSTPPISRRSRAWDAISNKSPAFWKNSDTKTRFRNCPGTHPGTDSSPRLEI